MIVEYISNKTNCYTLTTGKEIILEDKELEELQSYKIVEEEVNNLENTIDIQDGSVLNIYLDLEQ